MNTKKNPDERFLDAQIAFVMDTDADELDQLLKEIGFDPNDLETRGSAAIERASASINLALQPSDMLTSLLPPRQREIATRLGIRRNVFTALVEHRALVETIPKRFLKKLALEIGTTLETIALALSGPVRTLGAQHKSDQAPEVPTQVTFEQLIRDADMTELEITELLREDA